MALGALAGKAAMAGGRALGRGALAGGKVMGGAALMGAGGVVRQAASILPGGETAATAAMGGIAAGIGAIRGGGKQAAGGKAGAGTAGGGGGVAGSDNNVIGEILSTVKQLVKINTEGFKDVGRIRIVMDDMRAMAYEKARASLKAMPSTEIKQNQMLDLLRIIAGRGGGSQGADVGDQPGDTDTGGGSWLKTIGGTMLGLWLMEKIKQLKGWLGKRWQALKNLFSKTGWFARQFTALKLALEESKFYQAIKTFFGKEGWPAKQWATLRAWLSKTGGNFFKSIRTFFSAEGWIALKWAELRASIAKWKFPKIFGEGGAISTKLAEIRATIFASGTWTRLTSFFSKAGPIQTRIAAIGTAITKGRAAMMLKVGEIFGKEGVLAQRLAALRAGIQGTATNIKTTVVDKATKAWQGTKTFGTRIKGGIVEKFNSVRATMGGWMTKMHGIIEPFEKAGKDAFKFLTTNKAAKGIGTALTRLLPALGVIFTPLLWILGAWEALKGVKEGQAEDLAEGDADISTQVIAGFSGGISQVIEWFVGGIADLGLKLVGWLSGLLGFDKAKGAIDAFLAKGGVTQWIDDLFQAVIGIPIGAWKWLKGALGLNPEDAKSEKGKAGEDFMKKFKSRLAGMWDKFADLIPDFGDIGNIAMSVLGKIKIWFGDKIIGIGEWMKSKWGGKNIGKYFIKQGKAMRAEGSTMAASMESAKGGNGALGITSGDITSDGTNGTKGDQITEGANNGNGTTVGDINIKEGDNITTGSDGKSGNKDGVKVIVEQNAQHLAKADSEYFGGSVWGGP